MEHTMTIRGNSVQQLNKTSELWFICVEVLLYFSMACRIFGAQFGVLNILGLSGAIILASAAFSFIVMFYRHDKIPASIYFALIINIIANITDLYMYELFSRNMVYWLSFLIMACFVVKNNRSYFRFIIFLASSVLLSVYLGSQLFSHEFGISRLGLAEDTAGSMFANPNALAQVAAVTAIAILFYSLRCNFAMKLFSLAIAISLSTIVLLTISRTGLVMFGLGLLFYSFAILFGRKGMGDLLIIALLTIAVTTVFATQFDNIVTGYIYRLHEESDRITYWQSAPHDMLATFFSGQGSYDGYTSGGIKPHNTFLWLHLAFGGFCAWIYVGWLAWLVGATFRCVLLDTLNFVEKMELLAFCSMFLAVQFVAIFAPANFGFILGIAIVEKYIGLCKSPAYELRGDYSERSHA